MANTDKNVLITPNIGSSTAAPKIELTGADGTGSDKITLTSSYDGSVSTLSFEGTAGQLFSISNLDSDGDENLFAVNDKSGIPSLQVATDGTVILNPNSGRVLIGTAVDDGINQLQVDGSLSVTGTFINSGDISINDNDKILFGNGSDLQIYHDGSHSYIKDTATGNLRIDGTDIQIRSAAGANMAAFVSGAEVQLYHNNQKKLDTTATGISVTGDVVTTGPLAKTTGGTILRADISAWTSAPTHDILYWSSSTNNGDYLYLKVPENEASGHPILAMTEQGGLFYGTWDNESGALFDVATAPITNNLFRIDAAGNVTISGDLTVAGSQTSTGTAELNVTDIFITLNDGETGPGITAPAGLSGIKIDRGPESDSAEWLFNETTDKWTSNFPLGITGGSSTFTGGSMTVTSDGADAAGAEINLKHANNNVNDVVSTVNFSNNIGSVARIQGGTVGANNSGYIDFFTDNAGVDGFVARMLPNGNVGIGTNLPSALLDVEAASPVIELRATTTTATTLGAKNNRILLTSNSTTAGAGGEIVFNTSDSTTGRWGAISGHITENASGEAKGDIVFATKATTAATSLAERMRIDASGKVSIGTIAGTVEKLSVKSTGTQDGQIILEHSGNANPIVQIGQSNNHGSIKINTNGSVVNTYLGASANENYINASTRSNLGVGTTNPDELLHVFDSFNNAGTQTTLGTTTSRATIKVENDAAQEGAYASLFLRAGTADARIAAINTGSGNDTADLVFIVDDNVINNGTERMRIVGETGNVGIGVSAPSGLLEISTQLSGSNLVDFPVVISSRDDNNSINQLEGAGVGIKFRIAGNDATTPGNSFVGAGIAAIRESDTDASSNTGLVFYTSENDETLDERVRIDDVGNLLVGTTSTAVGSSTTEEGFTYIAGQDVQVARENGTVAVFNRWGTIPAGTVVSIKSDGAEVGSIGTFNEDLVLGTGVVGLRMNDGGNTVAPHRMDTNNVADNFVDLGNASGRWKDLYLSNAVYANQLTVNQPKPYTPAHFKAIGGITGPTDVLTIETYRSDVDDAFTGGSIVFVNSDTNSAGQARIKVGSANNVAPIGLNNEVVQSFIFETSTQGTATTSNIDGNATTITVTHTAASLVVGQRIAITAGTYAGSYTIDTVLSSTQFTIADTAHNLAADTTSRTVQYGIPRDSMIIRSDGHVGMGKAINPRADLHVQAVANTLDGGTTTVRLGAGDNGDGNMTNILQFSETGDTNGGMIYGYSIYNDGASGTTDNGLVFRRHENDDVGSTVLYLARNSNRVGINDANPNATLEVTGEDITDTPGDEKVHTIIGGARHHLDFKEVRTAAPSVTGNWDNTTYKLQMRVDGTEHQSIDFVSDNAFLEHIDIRTGNEGFSTRFHQNGNVGIGTSVPGEALHVFRNVNSEKGIIIQNSNTGNAAAAIIKLNANGNNFYIKNWGDGTATANLTEFSSEATGSDFAFMPNNNVGIGTTNPTSTLHVEKDTNDTNPLVLLKSLNPAATEGEVLRLLSSGRGGATVDIDIFSVDNADGQLFTIRNNGNVGIGVVPEHWGTAYDVLQVGTAASLAGSTDTSVAFLSSNAYFDVTNSRWEYISNDFASQYQQINGTHVFSTAATGVANNATNFVERLSVSQNGYVSINGTSGPSLFGTVASAATTSFTEIYSFDITLYGGAKFIVTIEDGSDRQIVELLVVHNGTNAFSTQYGSVLTTGSELATFDVDVNGNNVRLLASGHDASTHEYHTSAHLMAL